MDDLAFGPFLGMDLVALQYRLLRRELWEVLQRYSYSSPLPPDTVEVLLARRSAQRSKDCWHAWYLKGVICCPEGVEM